MHNLIIQTTNLEKKRKHFHFGPVNLEIKRGYITALLGKNGTGKSTLFEMLMGGLKPTNGSIDIFPSKEQIGYMGGQWYGTTIKIKKLASLYAYFYPTWSQETYQSLLNRYEIDEQLAYNKCSYGVKCKVEWIFAMAHTPDLLLLDEPSDGIDPSSQLKMIEDMLAYTEDETKSIFFSSHNVEEVAQLADYIYVMKEGQLTHRLEKDEIADNWACVWLQEELPVALENHPNIIELTVSPSQQIVTNDFSKLEQALQVHQLKIHRLQRLSFRDVIGYLL